MENNRRKASTKKESYKVVLVASNYIVIEKDGKNVFINGKFNVKIGDYIQL